MRVGEEIARGAHLIRGKDREPARLAPDPERAAVTAEYRGADLNRAPVVDGKQPESGERSPFSLGSVEFEEAPLLPTPRLSAAPRWSLLGIRFGSWAR